MASVTTRRRRPLAAIALLLLAAGVAAAVVRGGGDAGDLRHAARRLHDASPFQLRLRLSLVGADGTIHTVTSTATVDDEHDLAHLRLAEVVGPGDLELVGRADTLFLSVPGSLQSRVGARWLGVRTTSSADARGATLGDLPDPLSVLHALDVADDVGSPEARGDLTFQTFSVAVDRLRDGDADKRSRAAALGAMGSALTGEVWFDDAQLPRRMRLTADLAGGARIVALLDVIGIGRAVEIGVPPAADVRMVSDVAAALALVTAAP